MSFTQSSPMQLWTVAAAPFDDKNADVILRTSDNVDFYVYKLVLSLASPFFKDTFSLSQSPDSETAGTIPVASFTEDSSTIDYLLRLCYPIVDPAKPTDILTVAKYLEAAKKYDLVKATDLLRRTLRKFIRTEPLRVYAISCRRTLLLEEEACLAARAWQNSCPEGYHTFQTGKPLPFNLTAEGASYVEEMKNISAGCYHRLIEFIRSGVESTFCNPPLKVPTTNTLKTEDYTFIQDQILTVSAPLLARCPADILLKCSDGALVQTHRMILQMAAGFGTSWTSDETSQDGLPVVEVLEDSTTILSLLRLCYSPALLGGDADMAVPFNHLSRVWTAAQKYSMDDVASFARSRLMKSLATSPLQVFFTAVQNAWSAESEEAAAYLVHNLIKIQYIPEMEYSSATVLHQLFRLQNDHSQAVFDLAFRLGGNAALASSNLPDASSHFPSVVGLLVDSELSKAKDIIAALHTTPVQCSGRCNKNTLRLHCSWCGYRDWNIPKMPVLETTTIALLSESRKFEQDLSTMLSNPQLIALDPRSPRPSIRLSSLFTPPHHIEERNGTWDPTYAMRLQLS
ncbi:hypothetical protein BXZ70DRAFT_909353 [Cristinia sonorae]|uniref:BTB domain-containing protein n=1 Tax=Cristinia sonorae TaxID=1940300 RepID=A0A8K0UKC9_9AGAR|nr:hypothetical protein BXZ70DRAFT_909353 [Cristinia sonorae]